jgi:hypothetical protein
MTKITEIALEVDKVAQEAGEDPYEIFVNARKGENLDSPPVAYIAHMIDKCSQFDIAQIDRLVFGE